MKRIAGIAAAALLLAGCQTTQQTTAHLRNRWIGQPADTFFVSNGPPVSTFPRDGGGQIYTWRGGEHVTTQPATFTAVPVAPAANTGWWANSSAPDWWRAQATSGPRPGTYVGVLQPGRRMEYVCEARIVTDEAGTIQTIAISRDTDGVGLSFSRCAEIFGQ